MKWFLFKTRLALIFGLFAFILSASSLSYFYKQMYDAI
jgi:hypothetical protein